MDLLGLLKKWLNPPPQKIIFADNIEKYGRQVPTPSPLPEVLGSQTRQQVTPEQISAGIAKFGQRAGQTPPIATLAGELAHVGNTVGGNVDPLLPVVMALMESRGLLDPKPQKAANPYNIIPPGGLADYNGKPDVAITGGEAGGMKRQGLAGLLREGGVYQDYRNSGNLEDFFTHWSPPGASHGNPSMQELLNSYTSLRSLFQ